MNSATSAPQIGIAAYSEAIGVIDGMRKLPKPCRKLMPAETDHAEADREHDAAVEHLEHVAHAAAHRLGERGRERWSLRRVATAVPMKMP